ncbi:MAG: hypothetical protein ACLQPH_07550 [Acidimicrobiales bacterium]
MHSDTASRSLFVRDRPVATLAAPEAPVGPAPSSATTGRRDDPLGVGPTFRSPGLALLAAAAILEAYTWLGVMPSGGAWVSSIIFGRLGVAVFAVLATAAGAALTRPGSGRRRSAVQWLLVGATMATMATVPVVVFAGGPTSATALGVTDLVTACAAIGALVTGEHALRRCPGSAGMAESTDRALPIA